MGLSVVRLWCLQDWNSLPVYLLCSLPYMHVCMYGCLCPLSVKVISWDVHISIHQVLNSDMTKVVASLAY
jgi:hypothetical protein